MENNDDWTKYTIGDFVVWLFDYAEEQDDEYFTFCHRVYDELVYAFLKEKNVVESSKDEVHPWNDDAMIIFVEDGKPYEERYTNG